MNSLKFPAPEILVTSFGNWAGVEDTLQKLPTILKTSALWGQRKASERLVKILKGHIDNQDLGWEELVNPESSGDPRILVDYGTYRDNIKTWQKNNVRYVGVKKDVINHGGERVWMIAALHEFKSFNGGPYRALWEPSLKELGGPRGVTKIIEGVIANKIRKLSWG